MARHRYVLGMCDYRGTGKKNGEAAITWELEGVHFSMSAEIWNPRKFDCDVCGQCVDTVAGYFPNDAKAQRMLVIWRRWHLNDMRAGSPAQEAFLRDNPIIDRLHYFEAACGALVAAGLQPDPNHIHAGKPYRYGTAWLMEDLPSDVREEIESWD